jgi:hypothetical protein
MLVPSYCAFVCCFALRVLSVRGPRTNVLYGHSENRTVHIEHIICLTIVEQI